MNTQIFTTDEEIISEYTRLFNEVEVSKRYEALETLENQICPDKKDLWEFILKGLKCSLQGDGLIVNSYDNYDDYTNAYEAFNTAIKKIKDKDSLLFLFVEKERIGALALSLKKPVEEIIPLFDNLINRFESNPNLHIQTQVASAMLNKSFALGNYAQRDDNYELFKKSVFIENELINKYKDFEFGNIQRIVAVSMQNKAFNLERESERIMKEGLNTNNELINKYENSDSIAVLILVSKAMLNIALDWHTKYITEGAKQEEGLLVKQPEDNKAKAINAYDELIKNSKRLIIFPYKRELYGQCYKKLKYMFEMKIMRRHYMFVVKLKNIKI
jgi:hypothetical protein